MPDATRSGGPARHERYQLAAASHARLLVPGVRMDRRTVPADGSPAVRIRAAPGLGLDESEKRVALCASGPLDKSRCHGRHLRRSPTGQTRDRRAVAWLPRPPKNEQPVLAGFELTPSVVPLNDAEKARTSRPGLSTASALRRSSGSLRIRARSGADRMAPMRLVVRIERDLGGVRLRPVLERIRRHRRRTASLPVLYQ